MSTPVDSQSELPLYFPAGDDTLFGIVTQTDAATGDGAILLTGGGATAPSTNRNRVSVHLARRLATRGFSTLRFDYHGIGESGGVLAGAPKVDEPYLIDLDGAASVIREHGAERITLIGSCFGARTALAAGPEVSDIAGVVMVSPPLRDVPLKEETGTRFGLNMGLGEALRRSLHPRAIRGWLEPGRRRTYLRFLATKFSRAWQRITGASSIADAWVSEGFLDPIRRLACAERPDPVHLRNEGLALRGLPPRDGGAIGRGARERSARAAHRARGRGARSQQRGDTEPCHGPRRRMDRRAHRPPRSRTGAPA